MWFVLWCLQSEVVCCGVMGLYLVLCGLCGYWCGMARCGLNRVVWFSVVRCDVFRCVVV